MPEDAGYELLDAGEGRRLERFGDRLVDRPAPAAQEPPGDPNAWNRADLRFERHAGWTGSDEPWHVEIDGLRLELRPTEAGQVGLYPEHRMFWPWFDEVLAGAPGGEVLNLFASTGASSLALARAGARVTHVDAARSAVAWARRNAELSGLADRPIRWIVDDASTYVAREARRERRYAGIVLDPPSYGHGAGRAWRLEEGLGDLVWTCGRLLQPGGWLLLTVHTTGWDPDRLADALPPMIDDVATWESDALGLEARSGTVLPLGSWLRVMITP
jgi:23S rRNA (cytosine1962-C5)-methyltransferase